MLPKQVIADLRSVLANAQYIVGCLPHDEAHRSSLDQARRAIETVERILKDADGVPGIFPLGCERNGGSVRECPSHPACGCADGVGVTDHQTFPCEPPMDGSKP